MVPAAWGAVLVVAVVAIVDAVLAPAPWTVPVARVAPGVVPLGQDAELAWVVSNPARRALHVAIADEPAPSLHAQHRRVRLDLPPGEGARATTTLRPSRRGRFDLPALTVRTTGPLGLLARQHRRDRHDVLEVHPAFRSRREAELRITRGRILDVGLRSARALGRGTEFEALREYTPDDEVRRVDWAATARVGRPIVRTYRAERNQTVLVMLDSGRLMAGMVGDVPRLDHAMDAAMALTTVATRLGDRAGLMAFSAGVRAAVPPRGDRGQLARVTRAMFDLEPDLTESAYEDVFGVAVAQQRRRSLLVLLTELSSEALAETLVPALPLLLARHLVLVGSVQDPEVEAWRTDGTRGRRGGVPGCRGGDGPTCARPHRRAAATDGRPRGRRPAGRAGGPPGGRLPGGQGDGTVVTRPGRRRASPSAPVYPSAAAARPNPTT